MDEELLRARNVGMHDVLLEYMQEMPIQFVTGTILVDG